MMSIRQIDNSRRSIRPGILFALGLAVGIFAVGEGRAADAKSSEISFRRDIAPILQKKCVVCHGPKKSKGRYRADSFEKLLLAGSSGDASIVPGKPEESLLFQLIVTEDADDRMPQDDDPLPAKQVELIRRWIAAGAKFDGEDKSASLAGMIPGGAHPEAPESYNFAVPITALAFSPYGGEIAVGGYNEVTVWDPGTGRLLRRIGNAPRRIHGLSYSPKGRYLAVAGGSPGESGEVALIDLERGDKVASALTTADVVLDVAFDRTGKLMAAGGADHSISIFSVPDGKRLQHIEQHADWVMDVAFSDDGKRLASASRDRSARVYDVSDGSLLATYYGHNTSVYAAGFKPDGGLILSGGSDKSIHVWDPKDGKKKDAMSGFGDEIYAIHATDEFVFSCSADKVVRQHAIKGHKLVREFKGHQDQVYCLAYHEETGCLASGSYDGEVRIWNVKAGKLVAAFFAAPGLDNAGKP